ncbi:MAG TPA: DUF302 domain-containing protein [Thiolinea sp.]|nr:DUF302 domain-containing protein [Thiolinea sp.]
MTGWRSGLFGLVLAGLVLGQNLVIAADGVDDFTAPVYAVVVDKAFDDIVEDLQVSIGGHNFRLTEQARIGDAIAEREGRPFLRVTVLHFCNLELARRLLALKPSFSLRMPCRISVRETADGKVQIETLLLPEADGEAALDALAAEVNALLRDIVNEGVL